MTQQQDWRPIETAPRDGIPVEVMAEGMLAAVMYWDANRPSPITDKPGVWVEVDGSAVWSEGDGVGPTHWRPTMSPAVERVMRQFESALARRRAYGPPSMH